MKRLFIRLLAVCIAVSLSLCFVLPAGAQEEDKETGEFTLEEITVTAEKREENIQDIARSVVAITVDDINMRSADQVQEMIANTAGISFVAGGPWLNHIGMRGVIPNTSETGTEASVQFSVDGNVAMSNEGSISPMFAAMNDVERIEVIRGPSGAVSGRMAAAGSVRVITKSPDFEKYDGYVGYTTGNYDVSNIKAAINLPLKLTGLDLPAWLENLAVRYSIRQDKHSEYILNSAGEGVSGSTDFVTWRTKLKWQPIEAVTVDLQLSYNRDQSNNGMSVPLIDDGDSPHPEEPWVNANASAASNPAVAVQWNQSANILWTTFLGDVTGRYSKTWIPVDCDNAAGLPPGAVCYEGDKYQNEYEVYISSPADSRWKWTAGAYTFNKKEYTGPDETLTGVDLENLQIGFDQFYGGSGGPGGQNVWTENGYDTGSSAFPANNPDEWYDLVKDLGGPVSGESIYYYSESRTRPIDSYAYYGNVTPRFPPQY